MLEQGFARSCQEGLRGDCVESPASGLTVGTLGKCLLCLQRKILWGVCLCIAFWLLVVDVTMVLDWIQLEA